MFNGYNETPLISYNEFNQGRIEKKQENVPKWSYGHDAGVQSAQSHANNRHSEFWSGKSNFLGLPNVVKCNCTNCYPSSENQSYQGDTNRHRPWLPRTFPVLLNNSSESCKLPAYQWDNGLSGQSSCYSESNLPYVQENGEKYPYYRHYQNSRLPEPNQPGVITSVKDAEYVKKSKNEMSSRILESPIQNGTRQQVFCNPGYSLSKRNDGRNYCDLNDKYSNMASYSVEQHISRVPVVEPFIKAVPSNLSQNRVPSTGYRSVKENIPQPYIDSGFGGDRKISTEATINSDKRNEALLTGQLQSGAHVDHLHLKRDLHEEESQKLFFDNRHTDYFARNNIQDAMKRNNQILDNRKDCAVNQMSQINMPEHHYNMPRSKFQEGENLKSSYEAFYPEGIEKIKPESHLLENSGCFQKVEDTRSENTNIHARLSRSALLFNGPHFDSTQNSLPYQRDPVSYRNHLRPEYPYQNSNSQVRFEYPAGFQRNDFNQYKVTPQQIQSGEQFSTQQNRGFVYSLHCQQNSDKTQHFFGEKNPSSFKADFQAVENKKNNYLEAVRSEEIKKNGTNKISPLRLLRKKKFINVPQESTTASTLDSTPGLDVRKFWSTWAEEEEENLAPSQMVVLDCQNIDLEQAKLLNLYETDPVRPVHLESGNTVVKGSNSPKDSTDQADQFEQIKTYEEVVANEPKIDVQKSSENKKSAMQQKETEEAEDNNSVLVPEKESKSTIVEAICHMKSPSKYKKVKSEQENRSKKKSETMDRWTEKKFDFLKRAEESKAAEILRHEEEKRKIFETRQSIQQSLKKTEKQEKNIGGDESVPERISSFNDNLQNDSPLDGSLDTFNLPTSEYRRNKFLDYSDRKIMLNGKNEVENNVTVGANSYNCNGPNEEVKKEENIKLECSDKTLEKHSTEALLSSLNTKFKEETDVEIDDILKKISDINFQNTEFKTEDEIEKNIAKKSKPLLKKSKKNKSYHQTENDERKDKVTVETVSKPTIKFSIQKSHDLKISFKVLNSNKEYSDMDVRSEDIETKGNAMEDSTNSTELITLKYKSIQRDGDRRQSSDFIRNRRKFRRKKRAFEKKTPVLKIKKSRSRPEEERDSLADDDQCLKSSKKPHCEQYATSEDFQVQETVDSAKIKLIFKRHKGNFETEYKINGSDNEKVLAPELELIRKDFDNHLELTKSKKKPKRAKKKELFANADIKSYKNNLRPSSDVESGSENLKSHLESVLEEDSRNSSTSLDSCIEKENFDLKSKDPIFSELPLDYDKFMLSEVKKNCDVVRDLKLTGEANVYDQEQVEFTKSHVINCDEGNREKFSLPNYNLSPGVIVKELTMVEALLEKNQKEAENLKEEIQEISIDFINSTKSPEVETNHPSGEETEKTENTLNVDNNTEAFNEISSSEIKQSDNLKSPYESEFEKNDEKTFASKNLKIIEDLCDWKGDPLDSGDADKLSDNLFDNVKNRVKDSEEISNSFLSPFELENETFRKNFAFPEKSEVIIKTTKPNKVVLPSEKTTEPYPVEECVNYFRGSCENNNSFHPEPDKSTESDLEFGGAHLKTYIEDFVKHDIRCNISSLSRKSRIFSTSETSPKGFCIPVAEFKNSNDISEKLNEDINNCRKSLCLPHLEPEETDRSNFDLSLESGENIAESNLECTTPRTQRISDVIASIITKTPSQICENSSSELSPENNFSEFIDSSVTECQKIDYSPSFRTDAKSPVLDFEKAEPLSVNINNSKGDAHLEADGNGNQKVTELSEYSFPSLEKTISSEIALKSASNLSVDIIQPDKLTVADGEDSHNSAKDVDLSPFQEIIKGKENSLFSPKPDGLEQLREKLLRNISNCTTLSVSNQNVTINSIGQSFNNNIKPDLPLLSDIELEDGEIIDSSDELDKSSLDKKQTVNAVQSFNKFTNCNKTQRKYVNFVSRNIKRRHSTKPETLSKKKESQKCETWSERKFSRAKSCPPELKFSEEFLYKTEEAMNILAEDIPLPVGPAPYSSCLNITKYLSLRAQDKLFDSEAKVKSEKSIASEQPQVIQKEILPSDPPFGMSNFQNSLNPVGIAPVTEKVGSYHLGIFQRSSKIKFSFSKRSRLSKIDLKNVKKSQFDVSPQSSVSELKVQEEPEKKKVENSDFKSNKKIRTLGSVSTDQNVTLNKCQTEEVPMEIFEEVKNCSDSEDMKKPCKEQHVALLCEDLNEKVEVIDALNDFITDEFYECEDIPTSEDLTNGDDLENEKVNDDKFKNIMQNCLDNAKKFLNVGNLKLFSCSVDDLLELDCQASESALEETEPEKSNNHVSRDVLLTSCEDTSDDLGLSENVPPPDISMDFIPSFCSDVCSEILPVDNWPYLEEEVPSSPTKLKQDETNLIPSLENASLSITSETCLQFCPKNGIERSMRKQVIRENKFKSFRRRSLVSDEEGLRICSKIDAQRRKTIESFTGGSCGRDICDVKNELVKLNNETNKREERSLKCRLSLEKLTNKHEINFELKSEKMKREIKVGKKSARNLNYKSPSWQPRVMLFRISKNDLRKVVKSSNTHKLSKSNNSGNSPKKEICIDSKNIPAIKKQKFTSEFGYEERKVDGGDPSREKLINLPRLDSIKGSLTAVTSTNADAKRSRKSRFRNLHSKRKITSDMSKDENSCAQNIQFTKPSLVHAKTVLIKMFKKCNRSSNSPFKSTKEMICAEHEDEKLKRKLSEIKLSATENHQNANSKNEERLESSCSRGKSVEDLKEDKHCEKANKSHGHGDKRREKREEKEQRKQKNKHREVENKKHKKGDSRNRHLWMSSSANRESKGCKEENCRSANGRDEKKCKNQKEASREGPWTCEVCGFDDVNERMVHIKSHPFHCQSCHLAFKTEAYFISHLTRKHKDIRNQHHCLLCELSFDTQEQYRKHLETREHRHLESVEKNTINTLFTLLTGAPCPVLGLVEMKPEWLPNQAGTVHFYHQATPLSLALQYLKMHHDLSSFSTASSSTHPI